MDLEKFLIVAVAAGLTYLCTSLWQASLDCEAEFLSSARAKTLRTVRVRTLIILALSLSAIVTLHRLSFERGESLRDFQKVESRYRGEIQTLRRQNAQLVVAGERLKQPPRQPPAVRASAGTTARPVAVVVTDKALIRLSPMGPITFSLPYGTRVHLLGEPVAKASRLWRELTAPDGRTGWIASSLLSAEDGSSL